MQLLCTIVITALLLANLIAIVSYISLQYGHIYLTYGRQTLGQTFTLDDDATVLDTCPLKVIDPLSPELLSFHTPDYNPKKGCQVYRPWTVLRNGFIEVVKNETSCKARCLYPNKDSNIIKGDFRELPTNSSFECDIIETECNREGYNETEHYLHMQIYENKTSKSRTSSLPNVYMIVIDSTSTFMVKRALPKTLRFLKNNLGAVQMDFLNKVGDNSRPNGFPLLFGKSVEKVDRVGRPSEEPDWNNTEVCFEWLDEYPYILEEYKKKGYKSLVAGDSKSVIYYPFCKGLRRKEADHLYRPFHIQMYEKIYTEKLLGATCGESHLYMLQYLEMFMNAYAGLPKISLVWLTDLAHDTVYSLYHTDDQFLKFFTNNQKNLENSFVFFFGDHGPRYSDIHTVRLGRYENRNPFFLMALPKRIRNTAMHEELRAKSMQLMTHFDIHATLNDILHYPPYLKYWDTTEHRMLSISKGSSLLRKWQGPRNCQTLPIPFDYCICQYEKRNVTYVIRKQTNFNQI